MTAVISIILLTWAVNQLCSVLAELAQTVSEYRDKQKHLKRLQRTAQTACFMRDNTHDDTIREYYAERADELLQRLREEGKHEG